MASDSYVDLIKGFCQLVGIGDVARVLEHGTVEVDDVVFSLFRHQAQEGETLLVYCDYGPVPQGSEMQVYLRLLEINMFLSAGALPLSFAINPESGHVIFSYRALLGSLGAEALLDALQLCVAQATQWRRSQFLDVEAGNALMPSPASAARVAL